MRLSTIIPAYNEHQTIGEIVDRVCAAPIGDIEKEIIIANDGSSDGTRNIIAARAWSSDPRVKIYDSPINLGKGAAVRLGLHFATGDIVLIQDADLELDPNECLHTITPLLDALTPGERGQEDSMGGRSRCRLHAVQVPADRRTLRMAMAVVTSLHSRYYCAPF